MLDDVASHNEQVNLAIARRLVNDPSLGITRVTVIGAGGTHVIEHTPGPAPEMSDSRASDRAAAYGRRGIRNVLRVDPRKKQTT
jgi:hypothetical protein